MHLPSRKDQDNIDYTRELKLKITNRTPKNSDYTPFGMRMSQRSINSNEYKYGFNGMEKDDELKGEGNSYDFGARIYDPRVARFFSSDAKFKDFPNMSVYSISKNNPIYNIDKGGNEAIGYIGEDGKLYIEATYIYVSEGPGSFTENEIQVLESATECMYSGAAGMKVTYEGKEYEVGSVKINFVAGGLNRQVFDQVKEKFGNNYLIKAKTADVEYVHSYMSAGNILPKSVAAISVNLDTEEINTTFIKESTMNGTLLQEINNDKSSNGLPNISFPDGYDVIGNTIQDEAGHLLGTVHPGGNVPPNYVFGSLESGNTDTNSELILNQQDLQNCVNSCEFQMETE